MNAGEALPKPGVFLLFVSRYTATVDSSPDLQLGMTNRRIHVEQ